MSEKLDSSSKCTLIAIGIWIGASSFSVNCLKWVMESLI